MEPDEAEFLEFCKQATRRAQPMLIEKPDPRWFLAQEAAKNLRATRLLPDELPTVILGGQLMMFVEVLNESLRAFPSVFIFWRWANGFEPIATFSICWKGVKRNQQTDPVLINLLAEQRRVYMPLNDPRIENLLERPCLVVRIEPFSKSIINLLEIFPGEFDPPGALEGYEKAQELYIGDLEAARHYVYWNLHRPGEDASPADKLRASFIKRLEWEVRKAIWFINLNARRAVLAEAERARRETILAEATRLTAAGLDLYGEFPYHREVYGYCRKIWEGHSGNVIRPYFEHSKLCRDAGAPHLGYQLEKFLTAALFSVERTKCGLVLPSFNGQCELDLVELDPETMGKRAALFWERMEWDPAPYFRDAVGPGNIPADPYELFTRCPALESDLDEAEKHIQLFLSEAYAFKSAVIPPGAYHPIDQGGCLAAVRLHEFGSEVAATFVTHDGNFFILTMKADEGIWSLHVSAPDKLGSEVRAALEQDGTLEALPETLPVGEGKETYPIDEQIEAELKITRPVEVGLALFTSALIRDFWVIERRETIFSEKRTVRRVAKLHSERLKAVTIYLPHVRYIRRLTAESFAHLADSSRQPHDVREHMRRCANANPQQVALAKAIGFYLPKGFTFVRRHKRGEDSVERRYRSISALSLLGATRQTDPAGSFRDNWLEFERNTRNWLESSGWAIEQWSASQRGDYGIDIVISKADRLAIVQCKNWDPARPVGPNIIRELIGTRARVGKIVEALLVTSSRLTEGAVKEAQEAGVKFVQAVDFTKPSLLPKYD
jgi:hypothetical protein